VGFGDPHLLLMRNGQCKVFVMSVEKTPAVTVIIATYNKSSTLYYAIRSLLWQTFTDFECWIIGDACTDDSEEVVASFNDPRLNWYNLPHNSGYQSAPTNEGLRRAAGTYIAYLNHDDIWLPDHLQVLVQTIEREQADFAYSILEWVKDFGLRADIPILPDAPQPPEVPALLHRRDIVEELGYWKEPHEIIADPRVAFLRNAQFAGKKFVLAPYLTALKFIPYKEYYESSNQQAEYLERISTDPHFAEKELAGLLVEAYAQLSGPITLWRLRYELFQTIRHILIRRGLEPDILMPWLKPGSRISRWRKNRGLDPK